MWRRRRNEILKFGIEIKSETKNELKTIRWHRKNYKTPFLHTYLWNLFVSRASIDAQLTHKLVHRIVWSLYYYTAFFLFFD